MSELEQLRNNLAEGLQRRANWHLAAQEWDSYLRTISDLVTLYEHQNMTAEKVAGMMGEQGQDILRWVELANYAQHNLVQAIEHAQTVAQGLVTQENNREHKHLRELSADLSRRR
jgi:hypothetical protein